MVELTACHGADDEQRLIAVDYRCRQRVIRGVVRQVLFAGEEAYERPSPMGRLVADRAAQGGIAGFEGVKELDIPLKAAGSEKPSL